ncbi:potassium channel family protein [Actinomyces minihominis]|uniref:potassium channel family protein n=1 Tax=Actinomyces minihominis TaxID=2002838 RepID=UPI000C0857B8
MGCGRVGAMLADELDAQGHSVAIIDIRTSAFTRLGPDFSGQRIHGNGFDRATLKKAHIQDAYAFAAVSNGDNSNIIATRTVSELFGIDRVVARIADPERAELYERLGIPTVASTRRTATAVLKWMVPPNAEVVWTDPTGAVLLMAVRPSEAWYGEPFSKVEELTGARVAFVSRLSRVVPARQNYVVQENDLLILGTDGTDNAGIRDILAHNPNTAN